MLVKSSTKHPPINSVNSCLIRPPRRAKVNQKNPPILFQTRSKFIQQCGQIIPRSTKVKLPKTPRFLCPTTWPRKIKTMPWKWKSKMVKWALVNAGQHWSVSLKFRPVLVLNSSASYHTCEEEREATQVVWTNQEKREKNDVMSDIQMRREVTPIYTIRWGWGDTSIGLLEPTFDWGRPWQFVHERE